MSQPIPVLMPRQMEAFNGDFYIEQEFLKLRDQFSITKAIETGTCYGSTTIFLAKHFNEVATVELVEQYLNVAKDRFVDYRNIHAYFGASEKLLGSMITERSVDQHTIFFLDAHWGASCPLREELEAIAAAGIRPVIAIHDFQVPGEPALGFDSWNGQPFTIEWLQPYFDKVYGAGNYRWHFNSNEKSTQIKRGIIYVYPVTGTLLGPSSEVPRVDKDRSDKLPEHTHEQQFEHDMESAANAVDMNHIRGGVVTQEMNRPDPVAGKEFVGPQPAKESPGKVKLFVMYYEDPEPVRQAELWEALLENIGNPQIDSIYLIVEKVNADLTQIQRRAVAAGYDFAKLYPIYPFVNQMSRPTYRQLFDLMNMYMQLETDISILANTDIYFEAKDPQQPNKLSAIDGLHLHLKPYHCFALSAWDKTATGELQILKQNVGEENWVTKNDSQDAWIFRGRIQQIQETEFSMGKPGCDNAIANRIQGAGYAIANPSHAVKIIHVHATAIRRYDTKDYTKTGGVNPDRVYGEYLLLEPSGIEALPGMPEGWLPVSAAVAPKAKAKAKANENWLEEIKNVKAFPNQQSQFNEDAIIDFIFDHIGAGNKFFVDLGAGAYSGERMSNTRKLATSGWKGFGVDAKPCADPWVIQAFVKPATVVELLKSKETPLNFAFLSLDIDSSDFWVLREILKEFKPRLICTEFNGTLVPTESKVLKYEEQYTWDYTNKYGYSFGAGKKLLESFGYTIVHNLHDTDIFAIRTDLLEGLTIEVTAKQNFYHPTNLQANWENY